MATAEKKAPTVKGIKVVPKREGFRRAGHAFPAEGKTFALDDLTPAQLKQLKADPMLVTMDVEVPVAEEAKEA